MDAKQKLKYELTIATRCAPKMFKDTISIFSKEKKEVMGELGFSILAQLGCSNLNRELCQMLVENFDPINMCVQIHGKTISIGPQDFERIMGIRDGGGGTVDITGSIDEEDIKKMMKIYAQGGNEIKIINLQKYVKESEKIDDTFKIGVSLFVVATLLCPTVLDTVQPKFLLPLRDAMAIRTKNWATFCFFHLVEGVKSFKLRDSGFMDGCLLFLQLFYFDVISHGDMIVNKCLSPVVAWGDEEIHKLFKYVNENGGVHSTTVLVVKPHVDTKHVHPKSSKVYEDEVVTKADVIDLKADMLSLTMRIDQMEPQMNKMTTMQESIGRIEYSILNLETKLLDSLVEKVSKSLASKGEIPKERVMFPIEISSDECLRKQQSKRNDPPMIHNISSEYVRDHNSVPVPQNEV